MNRPEKPMLQPDILAKERPLKSRGSKVVRWVVVAVLVVPAIWAAMGLDIPVKRLLEAPGDIAVILREMLMPPEFSSKAFGRIFPAMMESIYIAWIGTMIGAFFSFLLAFPAAKNISPAWLSLSIRQIFNAIRAFPELLLAFVLLPITGLGAWTGTLAIGLHSIGTLGKLSSEVIEGIDPGPLEAIKAAGGRWNSVMRFGVLPQVMPTIVAYWLYRFEINIRVSAFLGVIGAGGIGSEMIVQLRYRDFPKAGAVLITVVFVVLIIDSISAAIRRRIIRGKADEMAPQELFEEPPSVGTL